MRKIVHLKLHGILRYCRKAFIIEGKSYLITQGSKTILKKALTWEVSRAEGPSVCPPSTPLCAFPGSCSEYGSGRRISQHRSGTKHTYSSNLSMLTKRRMKNDRALYLRSIGSHIENRQILWWCKYIVILNITDPSYYYYFNGQYQNTKHHFFNATVIYWRLSHWVTLA